MFVYDCIDGTAIISFSISEGQKKKKSDDDTAETSPQHLLFSNAMFFLRRKFSH